MRRGPVDVGRVLASIAALVGLVVALPVGLIAVSRARFGSANPLAGVDLGWFGDATSTLARPIADDTVIDGLIRLSLCVAWIAIFVIVATTVLEVAHMIRHRGLPTPSVRGLGWAQRIARFIAVGLIVLIPLSTSSPSIAESLSGRATPAPSREAAPSADAVSTVDARVSPARSDASAIGGASTVTHVVQPGESVYSIAERLAAANAADVIDIAESIVDANLDATMGPGQRFTTPAYVEVGWALQIPAHLVAAPVDEATPPSHPRCTPCSAATRCGTSPTNSSVTRRPGPRSGTSNAGDDMGGGRTFDDPDLILPGWELDLPTDDHAVPPRPRASGRRRSGRRTTRRRRTIPHPRHRPDVVVIETEPAPGHDHAGSANRAASRRAPSTAGTSTTSTIPAGLSGADSSGINGAPTDAPGAPSPLRMEHAALLAAGVLALVGVRRRQRLRAAMPRHRVPEPRPEAVETERRLRAIDAGERALRVDVACRAAAWSLIGTGAQIGWVEVTPDGDVGLRLSAPADLPAPWAGADHDWWLAADVPVELLSDDARRVGMPCVALVQLGVTAAGADVLIDLEACGTLAVEARRDQADEVITALAAGLASSMYAEVAHLIGVGLPSGALLGHRNAHVADSTDAALELARALVGIDGRQRADVVRTALVANRR